MRCIAARRPSAYNTTIRITPVVTRNHQVRSGGQPFQFAGQLRGACRSARGEKGQRREDAERAGVTMKGGSLIRVISRPLGTGQSADDKAQDQGCKAWTPWSKASAITIDEDHDRPATDRSQRSE